jgi:hypothetical protein
MARFTNTESMNAFVIARAGIAVIAAAPIGKNLACTDAIGDDIFDGT